MVRKASKSQIAKKYSLVELREILELKVQQEGHRLGDLRARREELSRELDEVTQQIELIEGVSPAPRRGRPPKKKAGRRGRPPKAGAKRGPKKTVKKSAKSAAPKRAPKKAAKKAAGKKTAGKRAAKAAPKKKAAKKSAPKRAPRAGRGGKMSIRAAITQVLKDAGKPLTAKDIRDTILEKNMLSNITKTFAQQVANTLSRGEEFKRDGDGRYSVA